MRDGYARIELLGSDHILGSFDSGVEELDRWLNNSAHTAGAAGTAATYLAMRDVRVVGYYSWR